MVFLPYFISKQVFPICTITKSVARHDMLCSLHTNRSFYHDKTYVVNLNCDKLLLQHQNCCNNPQFNCKVIRVQNTSVFPHFRNPQVIHL